MGSSQQSQIHDEVYREVSRRFAEALASRLESESGLTATVTVDELGAPRWEPLPEPAWLAPMTVTFLLDGVRQSASLLWPAVWQPEDYSACDLWTETPVRPGGHDGWYVGRPLAVGRGVRLEPGLHFIPRWSGGAAVVDVVLAPELGPDVRLSDAQGKAGSGAGAFAVALLGRRKGRFIPKSLTEAMLLQLGLDSGCRDVEEVARAVAARREDVGKSPHLEARRTAKSRNRVFSHDEVMAELVFAKLCSLTTRIRDLETRPQEWVDDFRKRLQYSGVSALKAIEFGRAGTQSVVGPVDASMTLARIEQRARTCFVGFRGLGKVRGRADLRDLESGWRGFLCPVQTVESADTGLVRFTAVGRAAAESEGLPDWFDLSASAALIPFINHNDPARASIGSKNLKQAVPVTGCEPPLVATGWEQHLGVEGTTRAPAGVSGEVGEIAEDHIEIRLDSGGSRLVGFGAPWTGQSGVENKWTVIAEPGRRVTAGEILAHAPDVSVLDAQAGVAELCLGVNAMVALTPWKGLNFEDAIVVSEAFAQRMTSIHLVRVAVDKNPDETMRWLVRPGDWVEKDELLGSMLRLGENRGLVQATAAGEVVRVEQALAQASVILRVQRPLAVGDKLSNRHQNKGVVSAILPAERLPALPDGTAVDVILNPLGVLRRLNVGQLWEMHVGMAARAEGTQRRVGRRFTGVPALRDELAKLEAPHGRVQLIYPAGDDAPRHTDGVVVGPQYLMKLDHLAADKLSVRGDDSAISLISRQPTQGARYRMGSPDGSRPARRVGSAQRLGEMEVWALEAEGAGAVLRDALGHRSAGVPWSAGRPRASLRSVQAHLAVGGLDLVTGKGAVPFGELSVGDVQELAPVWRVGNGAAAWTPGGTPVVGDLPTMPDWALLGRSSEELRKKWVGVPGSRPEGFTILVEAHARGLSAAQLRALTGISTQQLTLWRKTDPELNAVFERGVTEEAPSKRRRPLAVSIDEDLTAAVDRVAPLYAAAVHGEPGSKDHEVTRWSIPLPAPIRHPWQARGGPRLPWLASVPVLAPAYRLRNPSGARGLDYLYLRLVEACLEHSTAFDEVERAIDSDYRQAQKRAALRASARAREYARLILGTPGATDPDSILGRLSGKRGLLRRHLLGQTVLHSGRTVIVPDWDQSPDEVGVPLAIASGLGVNGLEPDGEVVFIVRQPTLQPHSVVALRARCLEAADGDAIRLHPIVLGGLAGDFDGDTVAVHRPTTPEARADAWARLAPAARLRSSADGSLIAKLDLDIALGLYLASGSETGRHRLGEWFTQIPERLDASTLPGALKTLKLPGDRKEALETLAALEEFALAQARGWSVGALDLMQSGRGGRMGEAIAAGVAGKAEAVSQLLDRRGAVLGAHPEATADLVKDSFLRGLSSADYFGTAPGALASLALKKLTTPHAGALTKTLVEISDAVTVQAATCGAPGERSPLTCRLEDGVCQACYGDDPATGEPPPLGRRVGVLAAMLIGERSTQLSMKAFQGGGATGRLDDSLRELRAVFGRGAAEAAFGTTPKGRPRSLLSFLRQNSDCGPDELARRLGPAVERACVLLDGRVARVHVQLVLRQLVDTVADLGILRTGAPRGQRRLVSCAERRGRSAFEMATSRGNVSWLLTDCGGKAGVSGGPRTRLATGGVL